MFKIPPSADIWAEEGQVQSHHKIWEAMLEPTEHNGLKHFSGVSSADRAKVFCTFCCVFSVRNKVILALKVLQKPLLSQAMFTKTLAELLFDNIWCSYLHWSDVMYFRSNKKSTLSRAWDAYITNGYSLPMCMLINSFGKKMRLVKGKTD